MEGMVLHKSFIFGRRYPAYSFGGLLGLITGVLSAAATSDTLLSLMRQTAYGPVSIVLLLPVSVLPFLIAAYAVSIDQWNILCLTAFFRFFGWGYCAFGCVLAFGSAAWLIQPMLQFTDNLSLILFCFFVSSRQRNRVHMIFLLMGIAVTVILDSCFVSPYLASLLSF